MLDIFEISPIDSGDVWDCIHEIADHTSILNDYTGHPFKRLRWWKYWHHPEIKEFREEYGDCLISKLNKLYEFVGRNLYYT